mmetsp:Transcript_25104/g.60417  ORF Transcript_25104/g.60417 Transcript_25104/m.60417 type:complete len:1605 (+) Transcript_25104:425-5239(+)
MGRRHRSSSTGSYALPSTPNNSVAAAATTTHSLKMLQQIDLDAANKLLNHFVHGCLNHNNGNNRKRNDVDYDYDNVKEGVGRTALHSAVEVASSALATSSSAEEEAKQLDGLFLTEALCTRMKELDNDSIIVSSSSTASSATKHGKSGSNNSGSGQQRQSSSYLRGLMLAPDVESGYTPLHIAVLNRDLISMMVLLGHASGNCNANNAQHHLQMMLHPLRLLDGNVLDTTDIMVTTTAGSREVDTNNRRFDVLNALAASTDRENLTPLQLLGRTSAGGLESCRRTLTWRSLRKMWKKRRAAAVAASSGHVEEGRGGMIGRTTNGSIIGRGGGGDADDNRTPRRYRRRMLSFGDERDSDSSLHYDIENEEDHAREDNHRQREGQRGRGRSSSFNVDLEDDDDDDDHPIDDEDDENGDGGGENDIDNNRLMPLDDDVDFNLLAENVIGEEDNDVSNSNQRTAMGQQEQQLPRSRADSIAGQHLPHVTTTAHVEDDYGCEVMTFGRADHSALGVPRFATASGRVTQADDFSSSSSNNSYKPKRVEAFALGELRRKWSSASFCLDDSLLVTSDEDDRVDREKDPVNSPAVSVAAATHHTLVATRSGQLYSFGYGKGGRLGTGDENHRPLPARVLGPLSKRIVASIAAAENHSLCSTNDGRVYAWGSNGFGQLGYSSSRDSSGGRDEVVVNASRLSPRRVEGELKQSFVVAVAAGDRHSVALTKLGEVYCWGDNRSGQLARFCSTLSSAGATSSPSSQANNRCSHRPQRVEALWSAQPRRRAIAIAAAEFSTLVLTKPPIVSTIESSLASLPVNTVYGWGHGNHSLVRVVFPSVERIARSSSTSSSAPIYSRSICINPTAIACAKYHNVAITANGRVYTWGLHSESLGIKKTPASGRKHSSDSDWATASESRSVASSSSISSPQLVSGMLPENGGGKAVGVSASETHTVIVTSDGHIFSWGTSHGNEVLGHKGVKWQPSPKKVKRIHRAVGVAAAKEHTVLLMATSFPALPNQSYQKGGPHHYVEPLSLQEHAAIEISRNVDIFNVVPVALVAHRLNCQPLMNYCAEFIRKNLDGVLSVGNKNDFTSFLSTKRACVVGETRCNYDCDWSFHPFLYHLANTKGWADDAKILLDKYAGSITAYPTAKRKDKKKPKQEEHQQLVASARQQQHEEEAVDTSTRIKQIVKKKAAKTFTKDSSKLVEANQQEPPIQVPRKLFPNDATSFQSKPSNAKGAAQKYHCTVCNVSCPDNDSYILHMNGRKHRNRLSHARTEEEKKVAESMMAMKRMQLMGKNSNHKPSLETLDSTPTSAWGITAKYTMPNKAITTASITLSKTPLASAATPKSKARVRSKSFQEILNEERSTSNADPPTTKQPPVLENSVAAATHTQSYSPAAFNMKAPGPTISSPVSSLPLSAFMKKNGKQRQQSDTMISAGASWGAKSSARHNTDSSKVSWGGAKPLNRKTALSKSKHVPPSSIKSFSKIQQEEEAFRCNEDHMCQIHGNQWYVEQRERAASLGEIQKQEAKDREMQDMIEEQKQIEKEIMKRVKQEKKEKKSEGSKEKQQQRQQQNGKNQQQARQKKKKNRQEKKKQTNEQAGVRNSDKNAAGPNP